MDVKITFDRYNVIEADKINDVKVVMVKGEKGDVGYPTDAQVETAVDEWLTAHPEVTTTVQDGSITEAKLANDVKGMFDEKADAIIKTSSGDIASFTDGGNGLLVKSLIANITPKQSGSGDPSPSNVRPISGYSEVVTSRVGKNLLKVNEYANVRQYGLFNYALGDSSIAFNQLPPTQHWPNLWISFDGIPTGTPITFSGTYTNPNSGATPNIALGYVDPNDANFSTYADITKKTISTTGSGTFSLTGTIPDGKLCALRMTPSNSNDASMVTQVFKVEEMQIELGSTVTAYEPYNGTTYTTSLGQTVYGGTLDVVSGKLVSDMATPIDLGSLEWRRDSNSGTYYFYATLSTPCAYAYNTPESQLKVTALPYSYKGTSGWAYMGNKTYGFTYNTIRIRDDSYTDPTSFKASLTNVTFSYGVATPIEVTLTPTQVNTLLGQNNIFADSGSVEVEYRADTTLAYNELLSLIASLS